MKCNLPTLRIPGSILQLMQVSSVYILLDKANVVIAGIYGTFMNGLGSIVGTLGAIPCVSPSHLLGWPA